MPEGAPIPLTIRPAKTSDLEAIVDIYNDVIASSSTIWSEATTTVDERLLWLSEKATANYPILVAEQDVVLGFIAAGPFRPWSGYAKSCEHSIHVRRDVRNRGVGSRLLEAMERELRAHDMHVMIAGIDAENEGSIRFHERAGFHQVSLMPEVGLLRGRWRDLVLLQKTIDGTANTLDG